MRVSHSTIVHMKVLISELKKKVKRNNNEAPLCKSVLVPCVERRLSGLVSILIQFNRMAVTTH